MKLGYVGSSAHHAVIKHSRNITLGIRQDTEAVIMEFATDEPQDDMPAINTCAAIRALSGNVELTKTFQELYNITTEPPATYLYGFIGEEGTSDFIEMTYSTRFMVGDVGPNVGFVKGTAIPVSDPFLAVPDFGPLVEGLQGMGYRGECTIGISPDYAICSVMFGTFLGGWCLYNELAKGRMESYYEFCIGGATPKGLHDNAVAVTCMMSTPPFPYAMGENDLEIPPDAENHVYVMKHGKTDVAYAAAWGTSIHEAKRRCRLTLENCTSLNDDLQYRIDYGYKESFVLMADRWETLGGVPARS